MAIERTENTARWPSFATSIAVIQRMRSRSVVTIGCVPAVALMLPAQSANNTRAAPHRRIIEFILMAALLRGNSGRNTNAPGACRAEPVQQSRADQLIKRRFELILGRQAHELLLHLAAFE